MKIRPEGGSADLDIEPIYDDYIESLKKVRFSAKNPSAWLDIQHRLLRRPVHSSDDHSSLAQFRNFDRENRKRVGGGQIFGACEQLFGKKGIMR